MVRRGTSADRRDKPRAASRGAREPERRRPRRPHPSSGGALPRGVAAALRARRVRHRRRPALPGGAGVGHRARARGRVARRRVSGHRRGERSPRPDRRRARRVRPRRSTTCAHRPEASAGARRLPPRARLAGHRRQRPRRTDGRGAARADRRGGPSSDDQHPHQPDARRRVRASGGARGGAVPRSTSCWPTPVRPTRSATTTTPCASSGRSGSSVAVSSRPDDGSRRRGRVDAPNDLFEATTDEIDELLSGSGPTADVLAERSSAPARWLRTSTHPCSSATTSHRRRSSCRRTWPSS